MQFDERETAHILAALRISERLELGGMSHLAILKGEHLSDAYERTSPTGPCLD